MDPIVRHVGYGDKVKFVVRWHGYGPTNDTVESPAYIPEHFIARYLHLV